MGAGADLHPVLQMVILLVRTHDGTYYDSVQETSMVADTLPVGNHLSLDLQFLIAVNLAAAGMMILPAQAHFGTGLIRRNIIRAIGRSKQIGVLWISRNDDLTITCAQWTDQGYITTALPHGISRCGIDLQHGERGTWALVRPLMPGVSCSTTLVDLHSATSAQ